MGELQIDHILPNGDCGLLLRFADTEHRLAAIHSLAADMLRSPLAAMTNVIPATDSLVLVFSKPVDFTSGLIDEIKFRVEQLTIGQGLVQTHEIPVCYAASLANDLEAVCAELQCSQQQLIERHTNSVYRVDMLGFLPGFAYLSGNHPAMQLPRKATPSLQVAQGSIAIAGQQTGIYSLASPGGWHVIGRTPIALLDWQNNSQPMLLKPMDKVTFIPISLTEFHAMEAAEESTNGH